MRRRWPRRSLRHSGHSNCSPGGKRGSEEEARKEAEKLLRDGEDELRLHLDTLCNHDR
jgi:hypothetical protein